VGDRRQQAQVHGQAPGGGEPPGGGQHIPARDVLRRDAHQVDGGTPAREGLLDLFLVRLEAADAPAQAPGQELDLLAQVQLAVLERPGDNGAEAGHGEDAVHRQARPALIRAGRRLRQHRIQGRDQLIQPLAGARGDWDDGRADQRRGAQALAHLFHDQVQPLGVLHEIRLGDGDNAARDLEQAEDVQVLLGLGHDALVGSDDEQGGVNPTDAGEHVLDEPFVAGHVHDAHLAAAGQREPGEAQVDGHLPFLLLDEAVRVDAGEGLDQGGLAVVHVAGRADDEQGSLQDPAAIPTSMGAPICHPAHHITTLTESS